MPRALKDHGRALRDLEPVLQVRMADISRKPQFVGSVPPPQAHLPFAESIASGFRTGPCRIDSGSSHPTSSRPLQGMRARDGSTCTHSVPHHVIPRASLERQHSRPLLELCHLEREALRTRQVALVRGHDDHAIDECAGLCGRTVWSDPCAYRLEIPSFTRPHSSRVAQVPASLRCHDRPVKHLFAKRRCTAVPARRLSRALMFWTGCRGAGSQWHRSQRNGSRRE